MWGGDKSAACEQYKFSNTLVTCTSAYKQAMYCPTTVPKFNTCCTVYTALYCIVSLVVRYSINKLVHITLTRACTVLQTCIVFALTIGSGLPLMQAVHVYAQCHVCMQW